MDSIPSVSPGNVEDITIRMFFMQLHDVKKEFSSVALSLTDNLMQAWHDYTHSKAAHTFLSKAQENKMKLKKLMYAANQLLNALKPSAKQRLLCQA